MKKIITIAASIFIASVAQANAYEITCFSQANNMCGEYSFSDVNTAQSFIQQCQSMGSQASEGRQCPSGGSGCYHKSPQASVTTYVYGMDPSTMASHCTQNGGQVVN